MGKLLLISIREKYVEEILTGNKTIELRKAKPKAEVGDLVIIYATQPKKAVTAIATVKSIITCSPSEMWKSYKRKLGIDKESFDAYYEDCLRAVGIELEDIIQLDSDILLSAIKLIHPKFSPPQTFKYLNKFAALRDFMNLNRIN